MGRPQQPPTDAADEAISGFLNRLHERVTYTGTGQPTINLEAVRRSLPEFLDELGVLSRTVCKTPESIEAVQKIQARTNKRNESDLPKRKPGRPKRLAE